MIKFYETNIYNDLMESDLLLKPKKMIYIPQNIEKSESSIPANIKDEIKEKSENKGNLHKCFFPRKNFILKSEICKNLLNSEEVNSKTNNKNQCNAIINYYYNTNFFQQNNTEDYTLTTNFTSNEKALKEDISLSTDNYRNKNVINIAQNLASKESPNSILNYNNLLEKDKGKQNFNESNFDYTQSISTNQINSPLINNIYNIIKTNNYYFSNRKDINVNYNKNNSNNSQILMIKDKFGCMMMKNKIASDPNYANEILFPQILKDLKDLCCDNFGNYFLQTFLDIITFDNLNKFLDLITKGFTDICISPLGTRVIQKIVDKISFTPMLINKFIYILNNEDLDIICKSQYGNHIIQKFILAFHSSEYTIFIYNFIYKNFIEITNSKHGVFIVQKCISEGNKIQREKLYKLILENLINIIQNEYGNYLVQFILSNKKDVQQTFQEILPIIEKIEQNLINLCVSKHSANVIEKCFENSDNIIRNHILDFLFNNHSNKVIEIFFNKFGIYVLLKASKTQNGKYKNKLIAAFTKNINNLKNNPSFNLKNCKKILKIVQKNKELEKIYQLIEENMNIE